MANEPQRDSEQLLNAWAAKRRAESGTPQLHPATRRMLHGEVARTYGANSPAPAERKSWLAGFWARVAFAGCGGAAVAVIALLLWPETRPSRPTMLAKLSGPETTDPKPIDALAEATPVMRRESDRALDKAKLAPAGAGGLAPVQAANELTVSGGAAPMNPRAKELIRQSGSVTLAEGTLPQSFSKEVKDAQVQTRNSLAPMNQPAAGATVAPTLQLAQRDAAQAELKSELGRTMQEPRAGGGAESQLSLAPSTVPPRSARTSIALGDGVALAAVAPMPAAPTPAPDAAPATPMLARPVKAAKSTGTTDALSPTEAEKLFADGGRADIGSKTRMSTTFQFAPADDRARLRKNFNSPAPAPVLNEFQFEQTGSTVRIIDADGSVYSGQIATALSSQSATRGLIVNADSLKRSSDQPQPGTRFENRRSGAAEPLTVLFRVQGTNTTRGQRVEFEGSLLLAAPDDSKLGAQPVPQGKVASQPVAPPAAPVMQIQGRAFVGREQFEVRANAVR